MGRTRRKVLATNPVFPFYLLVNWLICTGTFTDRLVGLEGEEDSREGRVYCPVVTWQLVAAEPADPGEERVERIVL